MSREQIEVAEELCAAFNLFSGRDSEIRDCNEGTCTRMEQCCTDQALNPIALAYGNDM